MRRNVLTPILIGLALFCDAAVSQNQGVDLIKHFSGLLTLSIDKLDAVFLVMCNLSTNELWAT
jgi:hypothetical protein